MTVTTVTWERFCHTHNTHYHREHLGHMNENQKYKFCVNENCEEFGRPVKADSRFCPTCDDNNFVVEDGIYISVVEDEIYISQDLSSQADVTFCPCGMPAFEGSNPPPCWSCKTPEDS